MLIDNELESILDSDYLLEDTHIDTFHQILREKTIFNPQSVLSIQAPLRITPIPEAEKHLQILFSRFR